MIDTMIRWLSPAKLIDSSDHYEAKSGRLLISYMLVIGGIVLFFVFFDYLGRKPISATINLVFWLALVALVLLYRIRAAQTVTAVLVVTCCQMLLGVQHLYAPDGLHANLFWPPLLTMMSVHLLAGTRGIALGLSTSLIVVAAAILRPVVGVQGDDFSANEIFRFHVISLALTVGAGLYVATRLATEMDQVFQRLETQKGEVFSLYETNSALLSIVGHDINNQLTTLTMQLHELERSPAGEVAGKLAAMKERISALGRIVKQTNELNALRAGKLAIRPVRVDLNEAVDRALRLMAEEVARKRLVVERGVPASDHVVEVMAEPYSLVSNVLSNVLSNAIKFSYDDGKVGLHVEETEDAVVLQVRDDGLGIPPELRPHLFDFNRPTTRSGARGEKGTGFGLPITKMFMDRYGASVEVSSGAGAGVAGGVGTTVSLRFRRPGVDLVDVAAEPTAAPS